VTLHRVVIPCARIESTDQPQEVPVSTFVLIPGAGGSSWYWHRLVPLLSAAGHRTITPDLPAANTTARLGDYVTHVVDRIDDGHDSDNFVVVGQSLGGLIAPIVAEKISARLLVMLVAMIPTPGESGGQWWEATGQSEAATAAATADGRNTNIFEDPNETFLHDLPPDVYAEALKRPTDQNDGPFIDPWPLTQWPPTPTKVIAGRNDRLFPLAFMQHLSRSRLGIEPDIIDTGHLPALAQPDRLAQLLLSYLDNTME
jgi:pimeloyl-ACP methyl ester carboxylesterase